MSVLITCKRCNQTKDEELFYFRKGRKNRHQPCKACRSELQHLKPKKGRIVPLETRFWRKVKKGDGCWLWLGSLSPTGYGRINIGDNRVEFAHRVSYQLNVAEIPPGQFVLHRCDNPPCVNPEHLFVGTQKDNAVDRESKGRGNQPINSGNGKCKVPESVVREIRLLRPTMTLRELSLKFSIPPGTISGIASGARRKYVI